MGDVYTIQLGAWRRARDAGVEMLDTTVRSGDKVFAPSWEMVHAVKSGALSHKNYTTAYTERMRASVRQHEARWRAVVALPAVALGCYCRSGTFCHRHLLATMLARCGEKWGVPVVLRGEL